MRGELSKSIGMNAYVYQYERQMIIFRIPSHTNVCTVNRFMHGKTSELTYFLFPYKKNYVVNMRRERSYICMLHHIHIHLSN